MCPYGYMIFVLYILVFYGRGASKAEEDAELE
jgi:hypothetical protein